MKKTFIVFLFAFSSINLYSQCSVVKIPIDSDIAFTAKSENIYRNEDLENGLLGAYFQLSVIQNGNNNNLLKFGCIVKVLSKRPKAPLVPRQIVVVFDNGEEIALTANTNDLTQPQAGITQNQCNYNFTSAEFKLFQTKAISRIIIKDNRTNEQITCNPYPALVQEQANCIASKL